MESFENIYILNSWMDEQLNRKIDKFSDKLNIGSFRLVHRRSTAFMYTKILDGNFGKTFLYFFISNATLLFEMSFQIIYAIVNT